MRRAFETNLTREFCLQQSLHFDWMAQNSPNLAMAARAWDQARWCRSLALVAKPAAEKARTPE